MGRMKIFRIKEPPVPVFFFWWKDQEPPVQVFPKMPQRTCGFHEITDKELKVILRKVI
jgi:hypothetical protein